MFAFKILLQKVICALCVIGILLPPQSLRAMNSIPVHVYPELKKMLHDPYSFDVYADEDLVQRFKKFHTSVDDKWFSHGLATQLRKLQQTYKPMNIELYSKLLERSYEALQLRDILEVKMAAWGRFSPQTFGTIARFMGDVFVPMMRIQGEGRMFPEVQALELQAALWPHYEWKASEATPLDLLDMRGPASLEKTRTSKTEEAVDYLKVLDSSIDQRLLVYAEALQASAKRSKEVVEARKELSVAQQKIANSTTVQSRGLVKDKNWEQLQKQLQQAKDKLEKLTSTARVREINKELQKLYVDSMKTKKFFGLRGETTFEPTPEAQEKIKNLEIERSLHLPPEQQQKRIVEFFAEASKLTTLQLMMRQIHFYQDIANVSRPLNMQQVAPSCMASYSGVPSSVNFTLSSQAERLVNMELFLANNGLMFSESENIKVEDYNNFFLGFEERDPFMGYYSGTMPFHRLRVAQQGKLYSLGKAPQADTMDSSSVNQSWSNLGIPEFHDVHDFPEVLSYVMSEATSHLKSEDQSEFEEVISLLPAPMVEVEEDSEYYPQFLDAQKWIGYTPHLKSKLAALSLTGDEWVKALSREAISQLRQNQLNIEFPSFYGAESYKQWALRLLYKALVNKDRAMETMDALCKHVPIQSADPMSGISGAETPKLSKSNCDSKDKFHSDIIAKLKRFENSGPFVPPSLSYSQGLSAHWGQLRVLWNHFRASGRFEDFEGEQAPVMDEFIFIRTQINHNPWAMLRVSVLSKVGDLKREIETLKKGKISSDKLSQKNRLLKAFESIPLGDLKFPLRPAYGNVLYPKSKGAWKFWKSKEERVYYKIWDSIESKFHDNNAHIFKLQASGAQDYYTLLEKLETMSLLDKKSVDTIIRQHSLDKQNFDSSEMKELIKMAEDSDESKRFELIFKIMKSPGDVDKHHELLNEYLEMTGDDSQISNPRDVMLSFLRRDASYKFPLLTQIVKASAMKRADELSANMDSLCALSSSDEKQWDKIMSMTGETQKQFNQAFGLESVPDEVMMFYNRGGGGFMGMDSRDTRNIGMMIAGFVGLGVASSLCASGVASVAGCPLTVSLLSVMSVTTLGYSTADFIMKSVEEAYGRGERMALGKTYESLGFSNKEAVDRMKGPGWGWVVFEVVTAGTMFVPIGLSTKILGRTAMSKIIEKEAAKKGVVSLETSRSAFEVLDTQASEVTLRLSANAPTTGKILSRFFESLKNIKDLNAWRTFKNKFSKEIVVTHSIANINKQTGVVLADYFKGNKKAFSNFVERNVNLKLDRAEKVLARAKIDENPKLLNRLSKYFRAMDLPPDRIVNFEAALLKERETLTRLAAELASSEGSDLATIIAKNADLLAPLLSDFTFHWWRLPNYLLYEGFFHGAPWGFTNRFLLRSVTNRAYVKHVFAAREKLITHSIRGAAQEAIDLSGKVAVFNQMALFRTAENLLIRNATHFVESADKSLVEAGNKALADWTAYKKKIAQHVLDANKDTTLNLAEVERLLFRSTLDESEKARLLLKKVDIPKMLEIADLKNNGDIMIRKMASEIRDLDSLSEYVALLAARIRLLSAPIKSHEVFSF